jgi:hypothetical protein
MFEELVAGGRRLALAGAPRKLPSTLVNGVAEMPVVLEPGA